MSHPAISAFSSSAATARKARQLHVRATSGTRKGCHGIQLADRVSVRGKHGRKVA